MKLLQKHYQVEISDSPDFLFYDVHNSGMEHYLYKNCIKIFCTGECAYPNFNECDYAIGLADIQFGDRYCQCFYLEKNEALINRAPYKNKSIDDKKFCNFIYSNASVGYGAEFRQVFCKRLMEYKRVDCPGSVLNNMPKGSIINRHDKDFVSACQNFQQNYKFTIAFENVSALGYTTEKIVNPFIAGSIPIYWGNPGITDQFNANAFINVADDIEAAINRIIEIDQNDDLYREMLLTQPLKDMSLYTTDWIKKRNDFILNIIEHGTSLKRQEQLPCAKTSCYLAEHSRRLVKQYNFRQSFSRLYHKIR